MNGATFSPCRTWRYTLTRDLVAPLAIGDEVESRCLFVCLNPSTADEKRDDPTVRRCERFAVCWGYTRLTVCNIFAFRSTDPKALYGPGPDDVVGPENDRHIVESARAASMVVCAWGTHGAHLSRGPLIAAKLRREGLALYHLGLTKDGHPRHPLYLRSDTEPTIWRP